MNSKFNKIEKAIMELLLQGNDPVLQILHYQFQKCSFSRRELTGVGFFTFFSVPNNIPRVNQKSFQFGDVLAGIKGLKNGAGFLLYVRQGLIYMLEGYTYDEKWPKKILDFHLNYINSKRDLIVLRKNWSE